MTTFADRLDELIAAAGGAGALSRAAGLSENYCNTLKTRIRRNADARPADDALEALARAGGVSYEWLRKGSEPKARTPETDVQVHPASNAEPFADALAVVFDGRRHTLADLDAARRVARETHHALRPEADPHAIAKTWLDAAARLRARGAEPTTSEILMFLSERAAEVDTRATADADAMLRARGIEPGAPAESIDALKKRIREQK